MMTTLQKIMPAHVPVLLEMLKRLQNFDVNDSSPLVKTKKIMITGVTMRTKNIMMTIKMKKIEMKVKMKKIEMRVEDSSRDDLSR